MSSRNGVAHKNVQLSEVNRSFKCCSIKERAIRVGEKGF